MQTKLQEPCIKATFLETILLSIHNTEVNEFPLFMKRIHEHYSKNRPYIFSDNFTFTLTLHSTQIHQPCCIYFKISCCAIRSILRHNFVISPRHYDMLNKSIILILSKPTTLKISWTIQCRIAGRLHIINSKECGRSCCALI